jgi:hypothetical protein
MKIRQAALPGFAFKIVEYSASIIQKVSPVQIVHKEEIISVTHRYMRKLCGEGARNTITGWDDLARVLKCLSNDK